MTARVERIGDRLGILLTQEEIDALYLHEGSVVDVSVPMPSEDSRDMTLQEGLEAFESTEAQYAAVYRALAK